MTVDLTKVRIRRCSCGARPALARSSMFGITSLRIECKCGKRGDTLMYTKPADAGRMRQAAADGWNLAG